MATSVIAFGFHPVGDYFTESDFYAGYVQGARALTAGRLDFARYGVYGPAYECALAALGTVTRDLFTAARLISLAAAVVTLLFTGWMARRRYGAVAAFWLVLLVSVNPTFIRYATSVGTDMLGVAGWTGAAALLVVGGGRNVAALAGILAALATLTRYNHVGLLPAGLAAIAIARTPGSRRIRDAAWFAGVFLAGTLPFFVAATLAGHPPGAVLASDAGFYLSESPQTILEERYAPAGPTSSPAPPGGSSWQRIAWRTARGIPSHLRDDARLLLLVPTAVACLLALAWLALRRRAGLLLPMAPLVAITFLVLAPVFYTERYSLPLLPLYLAPLAIVLAELAVRGRGPRVVAAAAALALAGWSLAGAIELQRMVHRSIPLEALEAGRALGRIAAPGERVLARKAHVAYHAGLDPVLFPDVSSLDSLASFARSRGVRYLYFSWYELRLRPRLGFLLDTAAVVPGLEPLHATFVKPSATYRIGPEFGGTPAWWSDDLERDRVRSRVNALMAPPDEAGRRFAESAELALALGRSSLGLGDATIAARLLPDDATPLLLSGIALLQLERPAEALRAFDAALAIRPGDTTAKTGRTEALRLLGRRE